MINFLGLEFERINKDYFGETVIFEYNKDINIHIEFVEGVVVRFYCVDFCGVFLGEYYTRRFFDYALDDTYYQKLIDEHVVNLILAMNKVYNIFKIAQNKKLASLVSEEIKLGNAKSVSNLHKVYEVLNFDKYLMLI